jgi:hypothetical protein
MGAVPRPVLTAIEVVLRNPCNEVADQQFKVTVFVVVKPAGTGRPLLWFANIPSASRQLTFLHVPSNIHTHVSAPSFAVAVFSFAPELPRNRLGERCATAATGGDEATVSKTSGANR